jgi:hypothetical protein
VACATTRRCCWCNGPVPDRAPAGHGHVLVEIARNPAARIRDISPVVGLTERSVQAIVADLEAAGYLTRTRTGRRVVYTVNRDCLFRHSAQEGLRVGPLLDVLTAGPRSHPDGTTAETAIPAADAVFTGDTMWDIQARFGRRCGGSEAAAFQDEFSSGHVFVESCSASRLLLPEFGVGGLGGGGALTAMHPGGEVKSGPAVPLAG